VVVEVSVAREIAMGWLMGAAGVSAGAAAMAAGVVLTWMCRGGPADIRHVMVLPIIALVLVVVGSSVVIRRTWLW
jgi:hypothetical protein